ncbi:hypothetical protein AB0H12_26165 [Actinosynnema sp. NPDC023794]
MSIATPAPDTPGADNPAGWGDPTRQARVRVEKSGLKVEVAVPSSQAPRLLHAAVLALVMSGVILGPVLTLRAVPVDFPVWATVGLVAGQIGLFGLVAMVARRAAGSGERARRHG